jgi:hypothetical protein
VIQAHPSDQISAAKWLRCRRLVTVHADELDALDILHDDRGGHPTLDGVIVVGSHATTAGRRLGVRRDDLTVLVEPSDFAGTNATAETPFVLPTGGLFDQTLPELVSERLANGQRYVLTPTGYLTAVNPAALKAVVEHANQIDTDKLIVTLPIDSAWLKPINVVQLTAVCNRSRHPLLVSLGANGEPLGTTEKADGLVKLLNSTEDVSLHRADHLVGLEALARTNGSASFGTIPSRRRITPPGQTGFASNKTEKRPHIYFPMLNRFVRGNISRDWFANTEPPICDTCCDRRALDTFRDSPVDHTAAMNHNVAAMLTKANLLTGTRAERMAALASIYYDGDEAHVNWSGRTGRQIKVPDDQRRLSVLSSMSPTTGRTPTR